MQQSRRRGVNVKSIGDQLARQLVDVKQSPDQSGVAMMEAAHGVVGVDAVPYAPRNRLKGANTTVARRAAYSRCRRTSAGLRRLSVFALDREVAS